MTEKISLDFKSDFIAACSLQRFHSQEDVDWSDVIFLPRMCLLRVRSCENEWVEPIFETLSASGKVVRLIAE